MFSSWILKPLALLLKCIHLPLGGAENFNKEQIVIGGGYENGSLRSRQHRDAALAEAFRHVLVSVNLNLVVSEGSVTFCGLSPVELSEEASALLIS